MGHGKKGVSRGQAQRMNDLLGDSQGLLVRPQRLVRIPKPAKIPGGKKVAKDPWVLAIEESVGLMPHGIVEGDALLQMFSGRNAFSPEHQRLSHGEMRLEEKCRILDAL